MEKMPCITNGTGHPKKIVIEIIIIIIIIIGDDMLVNSQTTTVPTKWRLASEEVVEEIIGRITREAASSAVIIGMRQVLVGKTIDRGSRGHTIYHPKIF
jgi:hypothetical protein